jgi:hypothetical protein
MNEADRIEALEAALERTVRVDASIVKQLSRSISINVRLRARIEALEAALQPFAQNVKAASLSKALGHITREHLLNVRAALDKATIDKGADFDT